VTTSKSWKKPAGAKHKSSGLVGLGVLKGVELLDKVKDICRATGAFAKRWGSLQPSPRIIEGFDEEWQTWGNWRALVRTVIGIRGGMDYDPTDPHEERLKLLWEGWPMDDLEAPQ